MAELIAQEARALAAEAFVFGYPLVLMDVSRAAMLGTPGPWGGQPNAFHHVRAFPDASFTSVVSPNADTLYSTAWLDLTAGPVELGVPSSGGRYYLLPMLSGWTDVFASPGTRTTGDGPATFVITGPGWHGQLPAGLPEIKSPTSMVWLLGRTQTNGAADYAAVQRFQDGLTLRPPPGGPRSGPGTAGTGPGADPAVPPPDQVAAMDAATFLGRLAALLVPNPAAAADEPELRRFAAIGLVPGSFQPPPSLASALDEGLQAGLAQLEALREHPPDQANGWAVSRNLGRYGTDYMKRAFVALAGLGANLPEDAVYPYTAVDSAGQRLTGAHRYRLRFGPGQLPPARAFWSLTMYNERQYFVANPLDRYAIGDRDPLVFGEDGSLDIWLQHETPGPERQANWLPAPAGPFSLILRIYWPGPEVIDGRWAPPEVSKLG